MKHASVALAVGLLQLLLSAATAAAPSSPPPVIPQLKQAAARVPIPGFDKAVESLYAGLVRGSDGSYSAKFTLDAPGIGRVPMQMYWFGDAVKQALILVVDRDVSLPQVFNNSTWKRLTGATLSDPIFSFSTVDYALDVRDMPADFRKIVSDSYFNVTSLNFSSGFQVAAHIKLGGAMKQVIETTMNAKMSEFTMRAGVVQPVPTDATGSASLAAQLAADMKDVTTTIKELPEFFVELQPKPGSVFQSPMGMSQLSLTDATFSLTSSSMFGLRGNMALQNGKKFILFFNTPLTPAGAMDFQDFSFGFTSQTVTLEDVALLNLALATPKVPGGSFIKGIDPYRNPLLQFAKPLSVFEIRNPNPIGEYRFGDATRPFPHKSLFSLLVMGPTAGSTDSNGQSLSGPYFQAVGDLTVLKQKMASLRLTVGQTGLHGFIDSDLKLRLGPLGKTAIRMRASADITAQQQLVLVSGNAVGRSLNARMDASSVSVESPATCDLPFEIRIRSEINLSLNLEQMLDNEPGVNVDPARIPNCVGKQLEAAYRWVSSTGKSLGGYSAASANAELSRIDNEAKAAYNAAKDRARDAANAASNTANNAFKSAGNMIKKFGRRKKNRAPPDYKFHASVFDWDYYYDSRPDVVAAGVDLASHWRDSGFWEGRSGSNEFNATYYLNRYPAIKAGCGTDLNCAAWHWVTYGIPAGLQGSPTFSVFDLARRYPDVEAAFGPENYEDILDWWLNDVTPGGRDGSPASSYAGPVNSPSVAGGGGGTEWSDRPVCGNRAVTGFNIAYGGSIDGLQFLYGDDRVWAQPHGITRWRDQVILDPGETFTSVEIAAGGRVDQLIFHTSRGRTFGPYGGGRPNNGYGATPGQAIGCMVGRSGSSIDQLTFAATGPR